MATVHRLIPRGRYLAHEVGRLAGVSGRKIGQWARRGYIRSSHSTKHPRVYSFQDVAEAMVVHELIDDKVPHKVIRATIDELRGTFGDWPLSTAPLATTGHDTDSAEEPGWRRLLLLDPDSLPYELHSDGWQGVAGVKLRKVAADLSRGGWVVREIPDVTHIEVNPERLSGRPTIRGRRLPVEMVAELAEEPGGEAVLIEDYDLSRDEIRDALRWWAATQRYDEAIAA